MRSRTAAAAASLPRTVAPAPATYGRVDHIAMVVLATVGCLLLLAPQRDPNTATDAVPRPPARTLNANCRILNSTLKLSSCDNYDGGYVYPLLITGVGRVQCINQIVAARLNHDLRAIGATPDRGRGVAVYCRCFQPAPHPTH